MNLKKEITSVNLLETQTALFYIGQVGFIIKYNNTYIMIDGYLSDYVDKNCSSSEVCWKRKYPAPIAAKDLDFIDYVFCTHTHYDHTDPYTIKDLLSVNPKAKFVISEAVKDCLTDYGVPSDRIIGVCADKEYSLYNNISFTPVPAAHEELHTDQNENFLELGYKITLGNTTVFHSGDCSMYDGLEDKIKGSDIVILPINGSDYFRTKNNIIGCFDCREAILLAKSVGAKMLIPVHFDLYSVNDVNPAYFVDILGKLNPYQRYHIFMPGEKYIIG